MASLLVATIHATSLLEPLIVVLLQNPYPSLTLLWPFILPVVNTPSATLRLSLLLEIFCDHHFKIEIKIKLYCYQRSVDQFILVSCPFWSGWQDVKFFEWQFFFFHVGRPLWREVGPLICSAMTQIQFQVILRPTDCWPVHLGAGPPMGPMTRFQFVCLKLLSFFSV
jgi:hypothetical protein